MTDSLFKSCNVETRRQYVALVESVREHGGKVHIFSSLHVSGEQLKQVNRTSPPLLPALPPRGLTRSRPRLIWLALPCQLSGIAAILRFPIPDLDVDDDDDGDDDDDDDDLEMDGTKFVDEGDGSRSTGANSSSAADADAPDNIQLAMEDMGLDDLM